MATEPVSPTRHPITRTVSLDENEIEFTAMRGRSSDPYRGAGAAGELLYIYLIIIVYNNHIQKA